jgi:hypothetical protein
MAIMSHAKKCGRSRAGVTTQIRCVNRNQQQVIRPTGNPDTDHGQYVYVLCCRACGHKYGAIGSDIFQRRCPAYARGAPRLAFRSWGADLRDRYIPAAHSTPTYNTSAAPTITAATITATRHQSSISRLGSSQSSSMVPGEHTVLLASNSP